MDAQIVHVDLEPLFSYHICEDVVHKCLESWWGVTESKKHDSRFEETEGSDECSLTLILFSNANVIVSPLDIEFDKRVESFMSLINSGMRGRGYLL